MSSVRLGRSGAATRDPETAVRDVGLGPGGPCRPRLTSPPLPLPAAFAGSLRSRAEKAWLPAGGPEIWPDSASFASRASMNTLTCAELLGYPGETFTDRVRSHYEESNPRMPAKRLGAANRGALEPLPNAHGALPIGRRIDLRRFTGRDRAERVANYLRAMVPRTTTWSEESLRSVAERLLTTADIVE